MKYFSRANVYKAGQNLVFNNETSEARSYDWYVLARVINGTMILNTYGYSNTTIKHVYKIRSLLAELGRPVHLEIEAPRGLQDLDSAIKYYESEIAELEAAIAKPRTQAAKNAKRRMQVLAMRTKIAKIKELQAYEQAIYGNEKGA